MDEVDEVDDVDLELGTLHLQSMLYVEVNMTLQSTYDTTYVAPKSIIVKYTPYSVLRTPYLKLF